MTSLFDAAGLEAPTTYEAIEAAAAALHDPDNDMYGITMNWAKQGGGISLIPWTNVLRSYGADQFDADFRPLQGSRVIQTVANQRDREDGQEDRQPRDGDRKSGVKDVWAI